MAVAFGDVLTWHIGILCLCAALRPVATVSTMGMYHTCGPDGRQGGKVFVFFFRLLVDTIWIKIDGNYTKFNDFLIVFDLWSILHAFLMLFFATF